MPTKWFRLDLERKNLWTPYFFLATQTDAKIKRDKVVGQANANLAHYEVGQKVRNTISSLGGTMPEELPTPDAVMKAQTRIKKSKSVKKIKT